MRFRPMKKIRLFDLKLSQSAVREVTHVLKSGWLTSGPKVTALEEAVGKLTGVRHAAAVSSCTSGLHLLLRAIELAPRARIITTPFTFVATVEAILLAGGKPVLADIDPVTLNVDPASVEARLTDTTQAVVAVDVAGHPADYPRLVPICRDAGIPLLADAAHSLGASVKGRSTPQLADAAVFSFYSTKNLTCGEGGMVVSRHKPWIESVRRLARHGLSSDTYSRNLSGQWQYDATELGLKANLSDIHAAVGLGQLSRFATDQHKRRKLAHRYLTNLANFTEFVQLPSIRKHYEHAWHLFILKLNLEVLSVDRERFIRLMARRGIECGWHYRPVFDLSFYRDALDLAREDFPNAVWAAQRVVTLPLYPGLRAYQVDYVCECIVSILRKHRR